MLKLVIDMNEATQIRYLDFIEDMEKGGWVFKDKNGYFGFCSLNEKIALRFSKHSN